MNTAQECIIKIHDRMEKRSAKPLAFVHSFGCQLNVCDGEKLGGMLEKMGYTLTDSVEGANLILYNTCAVRENAENHVFGTLGEIKKRKIQDPNIVLCVVGCMTAQQKIAERMQKSYPFVDIIMGTSALNTFPEVLLSHLEARELSGKRKTTLDLRYCPDIPEGLSAVRENKIKASVPIMYGCNNFCTYCIVPHVRGRERSRSHVQVLEEVRGLVAEGYKEIMLLGQNVNSYGKDLKDKGISFAQLLREIDTIEGEFWIRFMSSHPKDASEEMMDALLECKHTAKHLHLPVQSGSDTILRKMNRSYQIKQYLSQVSYIRGKCPDFSLTSDLIVGFPNESEEDFLATLSVMKSVRYDNVYSFIYSKREGTPACYMEDATPHSEKQERMGRLLALQREIALENNARFVGKTVRVLVDGRAARRQGYLTARTTENMLVECEGSEEKIGLFLDVKITDFHLGSLEGTFV